MSYEQLDLLPSREESQNKRARNRRDSTKLLTERGIAFESKNDGIHLIITHAGVKCDFWPTTGYWRFRNEGEKGRGVFPLLKLLENLEKSVEAKVSREAPLPIPRRSPQPSTNIPTDRSMSENTKLRETPVATTKQFRKDLDEVLQRLKKDVAEQRSSRERSLTITKIQEAIMWLGMDLKAQAEEGAEGCENLYPHSYDPKSETIDPTADGLKL